MEDLWGPIDQEHWQATPCIRGRQATEQDVKDGYAVFYVNGSAVPIFHFLPAHTSALRAALSNLSSLSRRRSFPTGPWLGFALWPAATAYACWVSYGFCLAALESRLPANNSFKPTPLRAAA